jgi:hypothetical protein
VWPPAHRYADKYDWVSVVVGAAGAICNGDRSTADHRALRPPRVRRARQPPTPTACCCAGAAMPVFSILFGNLMNSFGQNLDDYNNLTHQVNNYCLYFLFLAMGSAVAAFFMMFAWT